MRIVDYETFIRMPSGTIFAPWTPCTTLEEPEIKVDHGWEYTDDSGNARWMFDGTCVVMPRPVECDGFDFGECESMATALMHQNIKCSLFTKKMTSIIL